MKPNKTLTPAGFTLIELVIASSILLVILFTLHTSFNTGIFGYRNIEDSLNTAQTATKILQRMNSDLRNSFSYSSEETKFKGDKTEISFLSLVGASDYAFISYKLNNDNLERVCRRNQRSLNEQAPVMPVILASNLGGLSFSYGFFKTQDKSLEWKDTATAYPAAVKINLTIKSKLGRDNGVGEEFVRVIFLPLG